VYSKDAVLVSSITMSPTHRPRAFDGNATKQVSEAIGTALSSCQLKKGCTLAQRHGS
jgi:hypothetical protein